MTMLKQLIREFWLPFLVATVWTAYNVQWGTPPERGWSFSAIINLLGPTFFLAAWAVGQWFRVRKQQRVEQDLGNIETKLQRMLDDLDKKTTNLVNTAVGGDSFCFLWALPDNRTDVASNLLVEQRGQHPLRGVEVTLVDLGRLRVQAMAGPVPPDAQGEQFKIGDMPHGSARHIPQPLDCSNQTSVSVNAFFNAMNGSWKQYLRLQKAGGRWHRALSVVRDDKVIFEMVDEGYPRQADGSVQF